MSNNTNITDRWFNEVVRGKRKYIRKKDETKEKVFVSGTKIKDLRLYDLKHAPMTRERLKGTTLSDFAREKNYGSRRYTF
jgi:hypothetical protein